ncbi:hypothetical protein PHSC3_001353 [Chlamydiales bacterium STE3]|nr:hypothetical protein PHSC3_001353 [Chlamydiales bacterium STE3]
MSSTITRYIADNNTPVYDEKDYSLFLLARKLKLCPTEKTYHPGLGRKLMKGSTTLQGRLVLKNRKQGIPNEAFGLTFLVSLDLSHSPVKINESLKNLQSLRTCILKDCQLKKWPEEIFHLGKLEKLDLSENPIHNLPNENKTCSFGNLPNLQELKLSQCKISKFPKSLLTHSTLVVVDLSKNRLKTIPINLSGSSGQLDLIALQNLEKLDLNSNSFTKFPKAIALLANLRELDLSENKITAVLEKCVIRVKNWKREEKSLELPCLPGSLQYLNLKKNAIQTLNLNELLELISLKMSRNPFGHTRKLVLDQIPNIQYLSIPLDMYHKNTIKKLKILKTLKLGAQSPINEVTMKKINAILENLTNIHVEIKFSH